MFNTLVIIRGAGSLGSGVAYRLVKAGFPVLMTELPQPLLIHTTVSYGTCVVQEGVIVEGIEARRYTLDQVDEAHRAISSTFIPVVIDPEGETIRILRPSIVVDARDAGVNLDTKLEDAPLVIALGAGFTLGEDCHALVETHRGHNLGRVFSKGNIESDTGNHSNSNGSQCVLRAPCDGPMWQFAITGEVVKAGRLVATVDDQPVYTPSDGVVCGMVDTYVQVKQGMTIGEIDPHFKREDCFTISDKSLAVGGGVLEAIMSAPQLRTKLQYTPIEASS